MGHLVGHGAFGGLWGRLRFVGHLAVPGGLGTLGGLWGSWQSMGHLQSMGHVAVCGALGGVAVYQRIPPGTTGTHKFC